MSAKRRLGPDVELARDVIVELVRTGFVVSDAVSSLIEDLPPDAFPGENHAEVLLEMAAGSCAPVVRAAGEPLCREVIGLAAAVQDKFLADLRAAAQMRASKHQRW
jgi:hypothetical protein